MSIAERAACVIRGEELEAESVNVTNEEYRGLKALADLILKQAAVQKSADAAMQLVDAQKNETRENRARHLNALRN